MPAGALGNQGIAVVKQAGVATEFVDQEPAHPRRVLCVQNRLCADHLCDDPAPVDVPDQNHGHIGGHGKAHIGDVARAQVHLGRTARALDNHQIVLGFQAVKTVQHRVHQLRL